MSLLLRRLKEDWLQPFFFYGNNPLSLIGGALTTASAFVLVGFWVVSIFGHAGSNNPYLGIVLDLSLPGLFILGLVLIPDRHLVPPQAASSPPARCPPLIRTSTCATPPSVMGLKSSSSPPSSTSSSWGRPPTGASLTWTHPTSAASPAT